MSLDTQSGQGLADDPGNSDSHEPSFAEVALRMGGASTDEATRTGAIDSADDRVERLFAPEYQTTSSPAHRAVWDRTIPTRLFFGRPDPASDDVAKVVKQSLQIVREHRDLGTLLDEHGKIAPAVLDKLGSVGYWGLLVSPQYGGSGASMVQFSRMVTRMATLDPTIAGLASVHGCIGAVDPVRAFGTPDQKRRFLPGLASGQRLSAFALTEPGAGSDLTALRTNAVLDGNHYVVNGEKLFITNAVLGRTIGLVCKIDDKSAVLIVELPEQENDAFQLKQYGLYALRHAHNCGLIFKNFRVPAKNLLVPPMGDGLTIAYHGLNLGRVALCANAAGTMRSMLAEVLPWAHYRRTYGQSIECRELVQRRIGRLTGLIVAADAVSLWCASLLDQGYRGEMECIVAKIFGSEAQKEAAIEVLMKTHGGRSFLKGNWFGDNIHEFLAPCIYEGEGEMLGMAFFKSLVKHHGKDYFQPIGQALIQLGVNQPNPVNPRHLLALSRPVSRYAAWWVGNVVNGSHWSNLPPMPDRLRKHAQFAQRILSKAKFEVTATMRKHQLKLVDRQCRMSEISSKLQDAIVILVTSLYASQQDDPITTDAAAVMCSELKRKITGEQVTDADLKLVTSVGRSVVSDGWKELSGVTPRPIQMPYVRKD